MPQYGPVGATPINGKIVLITGGGSGIGLELAKQCHKVGAKVIVGDLRLTPEAEEWSSSLSQDTFYFQKCSVDDWKSLHALITSSVKHFGSVPDVYAPVAGVFEPLWSNFWDDSEDDIGTYKTLDINVKHPIKLTRMAIRACLGEKKIGTICLVASTAGIRGNYLSSLYCSSKHAIVGFAKSMGEADLEEGIRVVCICPGLVATRLWTDREPEFMEMNKYKERPALGPGDIAEVMVKMIENQQEEYSGGTVVLKTPLEEKIIEKGYDQQEGTYDPSPRPQADLSRMKGILENERGVKWNETYGQKR